ncbi:LysM peptidoglycan-binding domain-containing protein [Jeotgalibacillus sp. S-D1]|uniref:cell wall hydrolase n=1 Tax=Jeotgalibacillus sp. S-D1 TaxID=2552189 RepID=UPI00105A231D|nr:cell wall hydrolase [Jeotgalibacillus sp. S-D1]TDL34212.1 LysM peptidoglycan-binding domain-containing protein [Jeotgalibacillus sp. S-D1]
MKKWLIAGLVSLTAFSFPAAPTEAASQQYKVKSGDSLWKISQQYGITVDQLKTANGLSGNIIHPGQTLTTGEEKLNENELDLLSRLVHAEARGESYKGKAAVAAVILNRVESDEFPDSIEEVVYETHGNGNIYAFEPVQNGQITKHADQESIDAAKDAMNGYDPSNGALFFFNPETSTSKWVDQLTISSRIGDHVFASN